MFVIIGLILAFVLILIFSNRRTRNCRWRADRSGDVGRAACYRCRTCGAEGFTTTGKPPLDCQKPSPDM